MKYGKPGYGYAFELKVISRQDYVLIVESLPGRVDGYYFNHTFSKGTTIRKIKRLLGGSKYFDNI